MPPCAIARVRSATSYRTLPPRSMGRPTSSGIPRASLRAMRRLRTAGKIPAVMYGHGQEVALLSVGQHEFDNLMRHGGHGLLDAAQDRGHAPISASRPCSVSFIVPRGVDHVMLQVASLERSLPYYRALYGTAAERPKDKNGRVWFELAKNTRIALEQTTGKPAISHYAIKVAPFDRGALTKRLAEIGSAVIPSADEPDVLRFNDNYGITVELKVAE